MKVIAWPAFSTKKTNPYNWLLYSRMITEEGVVVQEFGVRNIVFKNYDIWHLHWPERYFNEKGVWLLPKVFSLFALILVAKLKGIRLVYTVHNLRSHEDKYPVLENCFWSLFLRSMNGCISLSEAAVELFLKTYPYCKGKPITVIPHGHYKEVFSPNHSRMSLRKKFGFSQNDFILAFIGTIRPFKNVVRLIKEFKKWNLPHVKLMVIGKADAQMTHAINNEVQDDVRITTILKFVEEAELSAFMAMTDLVVLPFSDTLNSGSAILSISLGRPTLVPNRGSLPELQRQTGDAWVKMYDGDITTEVLEQGKKWVERGARGAEPVLDSLDWGVLARSTLNFYKRICGE